MATVAAILIMSGAVARAGTIRLLPLAVVTGDTVTVGDVAELTGFSAADARALSVLKVASPPSPGGTAVVDMSGLRSALYKGGANLADIRLCGSSSCRITRPADPPQGPSRRTAESTEFRGSRENPESAGTGSKPMPSASVGRPPIDGATTLRRFIEMQVQQRVAHLGGRAVVVFEREADPLLELVSPPLEFFLTCRGGELGPATFTVDVRQEGALLQTITVRAEVLLARDAVIARRPILKEAIVSADDIEVRELVSRTGARAQVNEPSAVIGRQALRFFAPGETLDPQQFRTVPLIARDQMIRVVASMRGVRLETVGQALSSGSAGDVIRIRLLDRSSEPVEITGTIVGAGLVHVGTAADVRPVGADRRPQEVVLKESGE